MEILIFLGFVVGAYFAGYATRGFIGREVKALGAVYLADRAYLVADFKAELAKLKSDAVAVEKKF